jgi:hypothetical protein
MKVVEEITGEDRQDNVMEEDEQSDEANERTDDECTYERCIQ